MKLEDQVRIYTIRTRWTGVKWECEAVIDPEEVEWVDVGDGCVDTTVYCFSDACGGSREQAEAMHGEMIKLCEKE